MSQKIEIKLYWKVKVALIPLILTWKFIINKKKESNANTHMYKILDIVTFKIDTNKIRNVT